MRCSALYIKDNRHPLNTIHKVIPHERYTLHARLNQHSINRVIERDHTLVQNGKHHHFLLSEDDARDIFAHLKETIGQYWNVVCEDAELSEVDKKLFWGRQFSNPYSIEQ